MKVALATCAAFPSLFEDDAGLAPALRALGIDTTIAVWDDPSVDWRSYDLVVVRSTWDYVPRLAEYLAWADSVPRLANSAAVLRWNTDKRYLRDLQAAGVPIIPTTFVAPGQAYDPPAGEVVIKPSLSVAAMDTERFADATLGADLVARLHDEGRTAMVQPYMSAIDEAGETAVLVFNGVVSHAARKAPILVPGALPFLERDDVMSPRVATPAERAVALRAVAAAPEPLLYARVDLVPGPDGPVVIELEVTEPTLFLGLADGAAARFAAAIAARLR